MNEINSEKNTIKEQQSAPDQFKQASDTELKQSRELKWNMNMTDSEHGNQTGGCAMLPQLIRLYFLYYQSLLASGSTDMAQLQLPEIRTLTDKYCSREQNTTHIAGCSPGQVIIVDKLIHLYQKGERDLAEGIQVLSQVIQFLESRNEENQNFVQLLEILKEQQAPVEIPGKLISLNSHILHFCRTADVPLFRNIQLSLR